MNFDSWDDSLASPQKLAKLLGETDIQQGSLGVLSSRILQNSNQSRFSFAREKDEPSPFDPSFTGFDQTSRNHSFTNSFKNNGNYSVSGIINGFLVSTFGAQKPGSFAIVHRDSPKWFSAL